MKSSSIIALLFTLMSCTGTQQDNGRQSHDESLTRLAWEMRRDGCPIDSIIEVQKSAVKQLHNGESGDNPIEVLEQMGYLYNIAGDYASAIKFYEEAADSLKAAPLSTRNDGAIQLFGDVSSLYSYLGMTDKALEYNDSAIEESKRQNGIMLSDVYRFRASIFERENNVPEAMNCYGNALAAVENGAARTDKELLKALILGERAYLMINAYPDDMDSVNTAVSILEDVVRYDEFDTSDRIYALGLGYIKQGKAGKGIRLLQDAAERYRSQKDLERINVANTSLLKTYARYGMYKELAALVPEYIEYTDSLIKEDHANALIGALVRHDVRITEDQNRMLKLQIELGRKTKEINICLTMIAFFILTACVIILYQRNRLLNQKRLIQAKEFQELKESNTILNESTTILSERVNVLEKDISAGMNSSSSILSDPQLISGKEEGRFRRAFNVLYPDFIQSLKQDYPNLTQNDELLCMLLYLRHTTEEISVYLGISKASVNSARYRLRIKFALPKNVELDTFITERHI